MEQQSQAHQLLVSIVDGVFVVDSVTFADGLGIRHKSFVETIRTYQTGIESAFGPIKTETRQSGGTNGRGCPTVIYLLTKDQALFVGTLTRNSKQAVAFKRVLVESLRSWRRQVTEPAL